jgi:hypothetical protein
MRRPLAPLAVIVSTLLLVAACWAWIAGYYWDDPVEIRRLGMYYNPATGGDWWSLHVGAHGGGVYFSDDETKPFLRRDPFLTLHFRRAAGTREWHVGRVKNAGAQILCVTFPDTRCAPPQAGDLLAPNWRQLGFRAFSFSSSDKVGFAVVVPCWLLVVLTAAAPALWLRRLVRRRRWRIEGRCPRCGYDLRGSPGRCPECGEESKA